MALLLLCHNLGAGRRRLLRILLAVFLAPTIDDPYRGTPLFHGYWRLCSICHLWSQPTNAESLGVGGQQSPGAENHVTGLTRQKSELPRVIGHGMGSLKDTSEVLAAFGRSPSWESLSLFHPLHEFGQVWQQLQFLSLQKRQHLCLTGPLSLWSLHGLWQASVVCITDVLWRGYDSSKCSSPLQGTLEAAICVPLNKHGITGLQL